ncbi:isochorismatase family protein [Alteromonas sp. 5E99-2]|uniref:isochorismatase family protein n=1 Tax=Alteromonas sp. 5E99-2 TaxID=2817683 RepID=UPI001A99A73C|nr:isochorismatase family protein [Alteromonas sp. 5E99-2]MBO1255923.1 isochorismatase family protein [Alteromonas sp. 5E99-2]
MIQDELEPRELKFGKKPALIVVSMTNGFTRALTPFYHATDDIINANQRLLSALRLSAIPICFTTLVITEENQNSILPQMKPELKKFTLGSNLIQIDTRMGRLSNEPIFEKSGPSPFIDTNLSAWLILNEIDSLLISGVSTSGCIRATVIGGAQHNYPMWVVKDACGDRNKKAHEANLYDIENQYACLKTVNDIIKLISPSQSLSDSDLI